MCHRSSAYTDSEDDHRFLRGEAILVTNCRKLINGRSVFGVNELEIPIGAIVIDDAHACLSDIKEQFSIVLPRGNPLGEDVIKILSSQLKNYNPILFSRIAEEDPSAIFEVPYWIWKSLKREIADLILKHKEEKEVVFKKALVLPALEFCQCVVTGKTLTFAPRHLPIDVIPSFTHAKRKIYMTATLANDGILVSHLRADASAIQRPIKPKGAGDMGTRMILAPMELNRDFTFDQLQKLATTVAKERNVVVITPSTFTANKWKPLADQFLDRTNLYEGVEKLRSGRVGLTVMANKYDGIDLPFEACELLILDGAPEVDGEIERLNSLALEGTKSSRINTIQKIEQGMGRGVRDAEDFCAVLLWGPKLTRLINIPASFEHFTEATKVQLSIARRLSSQILSGDEEVDQEKLLGVLNYSFYKNQDWRNGSKKELARAQPERDYFAEDFVPKARAAFDYAMAGSFERSCEALQTAANSESDPRTQGYILSQLAEMTYHRDQLESFGVLARASQLNPAVTKPIEGLEYKRISAPENQAIASVRFMRQFMHGDDLILWLKELQIDLAFNPQTTKRFEAAMRDVGLWLGFGSHRPEEETRKGPDNLWAVGNNQYYVIECKSGSVSNEISKVDLNQLAGSVHWFMEKYPPDAEAIPLIVHPRSVCTQEATPHADALVIDQDGMASLSSNLAEFARSLAAGHSFAEPEKVRERLGHFGLTSQTFLSKFAKKIRQRG